MVGSATNSPMTIHLTARDHEILATLSTARYLTTDQIQQLFWNGATGSVGPRKACERRLRKLREQGFVRAIEQPVTRAEASKPYIYTLAERGAAHLGFHPREIEEATPSYPFLTHLLRTNDLRIAVLLACDRLGLTLVEWLDEKLLRSTGRKEYVVLPGSEGASERAGVTPDAAFLIQRSEKKALFFVEVDDATVTVAPSIWQRRGWTRKIRVYLAYFASECYQKRYGNRPARVLTVTTGEKRLQHLKAATEQAGGDRRFWFATLDNATDAAKLFTEPIWQPAQAKERLAILG